MVVPALLSPRVHLGALSVRLHGRHGRGAAGVYGTRARRAAQDRVVNEAIN